jgi:hypothetical protein
MGENTVAHDISHGLKANQKIRADGLRRRDIGDHPGLEVNPVSGGNMIATRAGDKA